MRSAVSYVVRVFTLSVVYLGDSTTRDSAICLDKTPPACNEFIDYRSLFYQFPTSSHTATNAPQWLGWAPIPVLRDPVRSADPAPYYFSLAVLSTVVKTRVQS